MMNIEHLKKRLQEYQQRHAQMLQQVEHNKAELYAAHGAILAISREIEDAQAETAHDLELVEKAE